MINVKKIFRGFGYAFSGIRELFISENSFRVEVLILMLVIGLTVYFPMTIMERIVLFLLVGLIMMFEIFNTAIEKILDIHKVYHPEYDLSIKFIKDIMAGAVLVGGIVLLVVIGMIVYDYI